MAKTGPLGVAVVGCGNIATRYAKTMAAYPEKITIKGFNDLECARAEALAKEHGGKVYQTLDEVLADPEVDAVVNLTIHQAHVEVITKCLEAGKHVHSEKPLAMDANEAKKLVQLAKRKKRRLSSAPITFMGECQQTAWKLIREGRLGTVRVIFAEMNWGRIESWHPNPGPFYEVGAMFDVGVYPLTVITSIFGPAKRVDGFGRVVWPDRVTKEGKPIHIETPDFVCGYVEFESGPILRLTAGFYVGPTKQTGVEFHGDKASLYLSTPHNFEGTVQVRDFGTTDWQDVPLVKEPFVGVEWSRGVTELYDAIQEKRPQRATGEQAAHVVEIIAGIHKAIQTGKAVNLKTKFTPPAPMPWAM